MVSPRAPSGNSNDATPVGVVIRQTAVPDFVSDPNFSHTNRYFPPAVACVRSTSRLPRLHSTFVASRPRPESSSITSGVNAIHQLGGYIFVTAGELSVAGARCAGWARVAVFRKDTAAKQISATNTRTTK